MAIKSYRRSCVQQQQVSARSWRQEAVAHGVDSLTEATVSPQQRRSFTSSSAVAPTGNAHTFSRLEAGVDFLRRAMHSFRLTPPLTLSS